MPGTVVAPEKGRSLLNCGMTPRWTRIHSPGIREEHGKPSNMAGVGKRGTCHLCDRSRCFAQLIAHATGRISMGGGQWEEDTYRVTFGVSRK